MVPQEPSIINWLWVLMEVHRGAFGQERVYLRAVALVLSEIVAFNGHRVTDLLRSLGLVGEDWSAWYRLWERPKRFVEEQAGAVLLGLTLELVAVSELYVMGIDTTQVWRDSRRMEGTSWLKCGRTPHWRIGIHRAQRFLNGSWLTPLSAGFCRAIPLRWLPAFPEKALRQAHPAHKEHLAGLAMVQWVRERLNAHGRGTQRVLCLADGSFDKPDFWRGLPEHATALVRTAKNRALYHRPGPYPGQGRRRTYGEKAPAPQDYAKRRTGWQTTTLTVRGKSRRTVYRVEGPFLRKSMADVPLMLICVRGQTWSRGGKTKRRAPCYYLVNAVEQHGLWTLPIPIEVLLTWAWQRWELEVVHREVKSLLGLGDKQCFNPQAAVASVQWSAWVYALLILAAYHTWGLPTPPAPSTAWYRHPKRWTLSTVLDSLRATLFTQSDFRPFFHPSLTNWPEMEAVVRHFSLSMPSQLQC
jgi:hypothetical protein